MVPLYESIRVGNGASVQTIHNPDYGGKLVSTPVLTDDSQPDTCSNTHNYHDEPSTVPLYESIQVGNSASVQTIHNPGYGGEVVNSGSKTTANPAYAEVDQAQEMILQGQISHKTVSFPMSQPPTPFVVLQPSPGGAGAKSKQ